MGIYDRDYYRQSLPRGIRAFSAWSVTTWLIVLNVAVFFVDAATKRMAAPPQMQTDVEDFPRTAVNDIGPLKQWGALSIEKAVMNFQVWRFISFQFLHQDPWHLLGNMIGLYFGPIVEAHFGSRRYLAFYLLCGLAGAVCFVVMALTNVLNVTMNAPLVGASAGIFGLLVASAMIAPDVQLFYYFIPVTIFMAAVVGMLFAAYMVLAMGTNAGGESAHLGGGVLGFVLMKNQQWLTPFAASMHQPARRRRRIRAGQKDWSKDLNR